MHSTGYKLYFLSKQVNEQMPPPPLWPLSVSSLGWGQRHLHFGTLDSNHQGLFWLGCRAPTVRLFLSVKLNWGQSLVPGRAPDNRQDQL